MVKKNNKLSSILTKMNLRTIIRSKLQFTAVILITAIAMTLFVGLTSNALSIKNRVNTLYNGSNIADIWTTTSNYDQNDLHQIDKLVGRNGKTEGRFTIPAKLQTFSATALMSEELPTISKPFQTDNNNKSNFFVIDYRLLDIERDPTSDVKWKDENGNYLSIPVSFSIANYQQLLKDTIIGHFDGIDVSVMDALNVCLLKDGENVFDNPYLDLNLQITGTMSFGENVQSSLMNNSSFLLSLDYFRSEVSNLISQNFANPSGFSQDDPQYELKSYLSNNNFVALAMMMVSNVTSYNQYVSQVDPKLNVENVRDEIEQYFANKENNNLLMCTDLDSLASNLTIQNDIVQASQLAYIFPIIFFLVAILVVLTTISQIIIKDRIQIGTMKAIGLTSQQIIVHYMALSVYIVLIGVIFGVIIGPFILPWVMNQKYDILYSLPAMNYTLAVPEMIISALVVLALTALVTFLIVKKEASLKPAEGMRPKEIKVVKSSKKERPITKKSIPIRMAYRNIRLSIARSLMVVIGIAGCTALLVCGFGIDDTLNHGIDNDVSRFFNADIYVAYNANNSKKDQLMSFQGVKEVEEYTCLPTTLSNGQMTYQSMVYVFADNSNFFKISNYDLKQDAIVSNKIAKQLNLKVGDEITFSSVGLNYSCRVGYILDCFYMHGIYVNKEFSNYADLANIKTNAWVKIDDTINSNNLMTQFNQINGVSSCKSRQESIDLINSYMSSISLMTLAVKIFAILLAIVVLYNLSLLNFKERSRDIATLKVLGFSQFEISQSLFIESLSLTIVGVGIGLCFGLPMEILVLVVNLTPLVEFLYTVYPLSYLVSFILTIGTAILVNLFLASKINKVKMVESLKSVE